jgi:hypothetical protein
MKIRSYFPQYQDDGAVITWFGEAKLVKFLDGKLELRDGSKDERIAAREWISLFMYEAVVKEN